MDDYYDSERFSYSYSPFRFHRRRPNSRTLHAKENVYGVVSTANWLGDYMIVASIINSLTRNSQSGMENDIQNLRELGRGKFFFNKMQRWMSLRDKHVGFTKSFNSGITFDVTCFLKNPEYPYRFVLLPPGSIYGVGGVYKRMGDKNFIMVFESGETYVAANTENDAYWMAGLTNMELLNATPGDGEMGELCFIQGEETCDTILARTEEIEAREVKKHYDANFPPLTDDDGFTVVKRRRQPKRACKKNGQQ